jgi:uncharacterized protein YdcH (DUF465 family)
MSQEENIGRRVAESEEFRRLRAEHHQHDEEIEILKRSTLLSAEQHWRVTELKKLKLMAKDRMEALIRHAGPGVTA